MRNFITLIIVLTCTFLCKGQSLNLVPIDSADFEIIADSLYDYNSILPDSLKKDYHESYKICPCRIDSINGLVSYKSSCFLIKNNKCLFLYKTDSMYFVRVGQMTNVKDDSGKYIWKLSTNKIKREIAEPYITLTKNEIDKAEVPRFKQIMIVYDGCGYTFGNLEKSLYATTPITFYSDSVIKLIELSEKIIRKNK